jgi:hypothetical protein
MKKIKSIGALILSTFLISGIADAQMQSLGPQDTLAESHLSQDEIRQVIAEVEQSAFDTPDSWEKELLAKKVDLGGKPGLAVRGSDLLCGATGNCQTWIMQKVNDNWVSLFLSDQVPIIEGFRLGPSVTAGIKDLTVSGNSGAQRRLIVKYKFDGKVYRVAREHQ